MVISWNRYTLKSSILLGFSIINHLFWGTHIYGNLQMGMVQKPWDDMAWEKNDLLTCWSTGKKKTSAQVSQPGLVARDPSRDPSKSSQTFVSAPPTWERKGSCQSGTPQKLQGSNRCRNYVIYTKNTCKNLSDPNLRKCFKRLHTLPRCSKKIPIFGSPGPGDQIWVASEGQATEKGCSCVLTWIISEAGFC